jgi:hypothetical protein
VYPNEDFSNKARAETGSHGVVARARGYCSEMPLPDMAHFTMKIAGLPPARFLKMTVGLYRKRTEEPNRCASIQELYINLKNKSHETQNTGRT